MLTRMVFLNRVPYIHISDIVPGVNMIDGKVNVETINRAGGPGGDLRGF